MTPLPPVNGQATQYASAKTQKEFMDRRIKQLNTLNDEIVTHVDKLEKNAPSKGLDAKRMLNPVG
jgi:hypothetical protein